jgi:aspartyl protease family protein
MPGPWGQPVPPPGPHKRPRLGLYLWLGVMVAAGLLLLGLNRWFPDGESPLGDPGLVQTLGFLVLASSSLLFLREFNLKQTVRNILLWLAVGLVLVLGFSFQNELGDLALRLRGALIPGYAVQTGTREVTLSEGEDGHYHVYGTINGVKIRFLIDTGATDIVLDPTDARRIGLKLEDLNFNRPFGSANGIGHGAGVVVDELVIGPVRFARVPVSVNGARMGSSLLGMAFLKRLKSYSFSGGKLILRW